MSGDWVEVFDKMQRDYRYQRVAPVGADFDPAFTPHFTPKEMLDLGVFEGKYLNDCTDEFPADWFEGGKLSDRADVSFNYFGIKSRQPLQEWQRKGWIVEPDVRGWFQWYCRYYMGRRMDQVDRWQIGRWKGFVRHAGQIRANCEEGDLSCRPRQRQGLLQWSHDPFI